MVYKINPPKTALLLIDVQREYFDENRPLYTPNARQIVRNLIRLRDAAARKGLHAIFVRHVHKRDGSDIGRMGDFDPTPVFVEGTPGVEFIPELVPGREDSVIDKTRYSAFVNTKLGQLLKGRKIDTLVIAGLMTNYCCVTTARHAHDLDYKVIFVHDANASPDMPDLGFGPVSNADVIRYIATTLAGGVADVLDTETVLKHLDTGS